MNKRERFLDYVKNGGAPICSPQIGAGAGFDTKLAGKEWMSQTTLEDTINAVERFDILPLFNVGIDVYMGNPAIIWKETFSDVQDDKVTRSHELVTPYGTLSQTMTEEKLKGSVRLKCPVTSVDDLDAMEYCLDVALDSDSSGITPYIADIVSKIDGRGVLDVQWPMQPYELLCFPDTVTTVMLAMDVPEKFKKIMNKIVLLNEKIIPAVAKGGADFVFLGGPASEMVSPMIYEEFIIPYSKIVTDMVHDAGMMVYAHICSPIEPFLTMGFYNRMGIDLFETLSPPPVGNIKSLEDAMSKIDPNICTRGNLGLEILLNADVETVKAKTREIVEATKGRKHIVAASDYIFYDVPEENVKAMVDAVNGK